MSLKDQINQLYYPHTWKPKISSNISIVEVDEGFVMNQTELGYQLSINKETFLLISSLDGTKSVQEIASDIAKYSNSSVETEKLFIFLRDNFLEKGFIESELNIKKRPNASFLFFKFAIIRNKLINWISSTWINWIFEKRFFYFSLIFTFLLNIFLYSYYTRQSITIKTSYWWLMVALFLCHFIHEWGHVFSAKAFGIKPKEIGFGIYYVLPVFYTDLSDSWNTSAKHRIIINFAGIYFEYVLALLFYLIYFITSNYFFVILASLTFFKTWYNLNPLLQSDMYWVLSDLLKCPNLTSDALLSVSHFRKNLKNFAQWKINHLQILLFLYGICVIIFWSYIIYQFLFFGNILIKQLPKNLFQISNMIKTNTFELNSLINNIYNILFFCFIVFILFFSIKRLLIFALSTVKNNF